VNNHIFFRSLQGDKKKENPFQLSYWLKIIMAEEIEKELRVFFPSEKPLGMPR